MLLHARTHAHERFCCCYCSVEKFFEVSYSRDHRVDIRHDGRILWSFGGNFLTSCTLDMTYYPFDLQQCDIDVESWAYTNESVHLYHLIDDVHLQVRWKYISPVFMGAGRILSRGGGGAHSDFGCTNICTELHRTMDIFIFSPHN